MKRLTNALRTHIKYKLSFVRYTQNMQRPTHIFVLINRQRGSEDNKDNIDAFQFNYTNLIIVSLKCKNYQRKPEYRTNSNSLTFTPLLIHKLISPSSLDRIQER